MSSTPAPDRPEVEVPDVVPQGFREAPPGTGVDRYTDQDLAWEPCGEHECADIAVPLDWADPDGQAITLSMRRVAATQQPRRGTIFLNPGGPGSSGKEMVEYFSHAGLEHYDLIGWDPRGVGDSTPVRCLDGAEMDEFLTVDASPDDEAEDAALEEAARGFGQRCLERSGPLLAHVSTTATVQDLDLLRGLVGDERLNYLGYSYGTEIGAVYAATFPDRVGRLVLDSAVSLADDSDVTQAEGFERALESFAEWCVEGDCDLGDDRDEVIRAVTGLLRHLDHQPLQVHDRELTQTLAVSGILMPLYGTKDWYPILADAVSAARSGRGQALLELADVYNERDIDGNYGSLMTAFNAIRCNTHVDLGLAGERARAKKEAEEAGALGPFMGPDLICPLWPAPVVPNPEDQTAPGAAPIMVIGARMDSATPYENAVDMADTFESGFLVTWEGDGHGTYGGTSTCVDDAVHRFFADDLPPEDLTCRE